jgi:hypothetical protein
MLTAALPNAQAVISQGLRAPTMRISRWPRNAFAASIKCHAPILFLGYESELRRAGVSAAGVAHSTGIGW